jgi:hypothetical protein
MNWEAIAVMIAAGGLIGAGLGFLLRGAFNAGEHKSGITSIVGEHGKRLDTHDDILRELPRNYVPRPEVEISLRDIRDDQRESKQLLLHLVTGKAIDPGIK